MPEIPVTEVPFSDWSVLPPAPGLCPECAVAHDPAAPHNRDSLHYHYWFRNREARAGREERWPTWVDAMAHCSAETRAEWRALLKEHGVDVDG